MLSKHPRLTIPTCPECGRIGSTWEKVCDWHHPMTPMEMRAYVAVDPLKEAGERTCNLLDASGRWREADSLREFLQAYAQ